MAVAEEEGVQVLMSAYNEANPAQEQNFSEVMIDKHSRLVFFVPIASLLLCIFFTAANVERRYAGACWLVFAIIFYHFVIERRELYYYVFSQDGINQYNIFTAKQRTIPWAQIVQIGIRKGGRTTGGMLVITILGAPKWNPGKKASSQAWYFLSNRPNVLILEKWRPAQSLIQAFYGPLDY